MLWKLYVLSQQLRFPTVNREMALAAGNLLEIRILKYLLHNF